MKTFTRELVSFYELSEAWQAEARSNLDEEAEETSYLMPEEDQEPGNHVLWDLSTCMRVEHQEYDGVIGISNNSALAVKLSDCGTEATCWYL